MAFETEDKLIQSGEGSVMDAGRRRRDLVELVVGYLLIMVVIWTPRALQRPFYVGAVAWIGVTTWMSFEGWKEMGLRVTGFMRSLWVVGVALLVAVVAVQVAQRLHTLHRPQTVALFVETFWGYGIWAFMQQFMLQNFFLLRLLRLLSGRQTAVAVAAGLFTLAHLPSPILTVVTLIWGLIACLLFLKYRNVYTLGMAHAILGICLAIVIPGPVDHNMRVGLGYVRYRPQQHRHLSQNDHRVSTDVWVRAAAPMRRS